MIKKFQLGFSPVLIVTAIVGLIVVGLVGWKLWDTYKPTQQSKTVPPTQESTQNQTQTTDPNAGYVVIKEWGVRFKAVEGLRGVEYYKPRGVVGEAYAFTTSELADLDVRCSVSSDMIVIGLLTRAQEIVPSAGGVIARIGNYYYQFRSSGAACNTSGNYDVIEGQTSLRIDQSLKSLEPAK